jgi:hypothetical protein
MIWQRYCRPFLYVSFRLAVTMVFWLIEVLLFVPDIIMGGYLLFVKHPKKTFSIVTILLLLWYTGILSSLISML